jgi:hypothetical protein
MSESPRPRGPAPHAIHLPLVGLVATLLLVGFFVVVSRGQSDFRRGRGEADAIWMAWCETQGHNERCAERLAADGTRCFGYAFRSDAPKVAPSLDPQRFVSCVEVGFRKMPNDPQRNVHGG